jgi:hypothetical protein
MNSPKGISISVRNNFYLNLLNVALFLIAAFTGAILQFEYHMHGLPEGYAVMGFNKPRWVLLHKASASMFLAGIVAHCSLNWKFVSASTRRILCRKLTPSASVSYWLFMISIPTSLTAMGSWTLFGLEDPARFLLVEIHDKLCWLLVMFLVMHIISRAGRMTRAYCKLSQGRGKRLEGSRRGG